MTQHQGTMEWGPHMDPTPLCFGVVSLLCSVSVRITPQKFNIYAFDQYKAFHVKYLNYGWMKALLTTFD
jgi:hypothetical protein